VNVAIAVASTVTLGGAGELVARLSETPTAAPADYITDWQAWDGDFYTVKSTAVGWPPWEDYNTEGLRDTEHSLAKRPGSWRIACLGDSVTLGWGIRRQEAWPHALEDLAAASDRDLEVMNVALGGWSTRQELIAYRRIVRRYRPDQVLLGICLNDVPEMQNNLSRPPAMLAALHRRSALVRRLVNARQREIRSVEELFTAPDGAAVRQGYERMFADLRTLRDEVRADGALFGIVVFPFRFQVGAGPPPPFAQRTIGDFCRREAIPFLDVLPAVSRLGEAAFHDYDHLSPEGSRLAAQEVLESGLIPSRAGLTGGATPPPAAAQTTAGKVLTTGRVEDEPALMAALRDPSPERRASAARSLGTLSAAAAPAVPSLVVALRDRDAEVRVAAAWALGDVGTAAAPALGVLSGLLEDRDALLRAGAAHALGEIGDAAEPVQLALVRRFDDPEQRVRWSAADALGKLGPAAVTLEPLRRIVAEAASPGRGLAAEALGRVGREARVALPELIGAASDARGDVRWRAVWAIGQLGPDAGPAVPLLRRALADPDLRWRAADALGAVGAGAVEAVPDLVALLDDPSSSVRWRASAALGAIGARGATPALVRAVSDAAENVRLAAVVALTRIADPPSVALPALLAALQDPDSRVRLHAVRGLRRLAGSSRPARAGVSRARHDPDPGVREEAARVRLEGGP